MKNIMYYNYDKNNHYTDICFLFLTKYILILAAFMLVANIYKKTTLKCDLYIQDLVWLKKQLS